MTIARLKELGELITEGTIGKGLLFLELLLETKMLLYTKIGCHDTDICYKQLVASTAATMSSPTSAGSDSRQ